MELRADVLVTMEKSLGFAMETVIQSLLAEEINVITSAYKTTCLLNPSIISGISVDDLESAEKRIVELGGQFRQGVLIDANAVLASSIDRTSPRSSLNKSGEHNRVGLAKSGEHKRTTSFSRSVSPNSPTRSAIP